MVGFIISPSPVNIHSSETLKKSDIFFKTLKLGFVLRFINLCKVLSLMFVILEHSFYDTVCVLNELSESKKLAKTIYHRWLNEIKNYFLTSKQVA